MKEIAKRKRINKSNTEPVAEIWPDPADSLCPLSPKTVEKICSDLLIFAENEDSIKLSEFSCARRWTYKELYDLAERHPSIARAMDIARTMIGNRRERFGLKNIYNAALVEKTLGIYDPEYREETKRRAQLTQTNNEAVRLNIGLYSIPDAGVSTPEQRAQQIEAKKEVNEDNSRRDI